MNTECLQYLPTWITTAAGQKNPEKTNKQNMVMNAYKELLGTCIKSKKEHI